ncbi:MAG: guanylate kinase [Phycisphaeraceae bacterium]|nr:guanylate kinase [Phycisphaeraceae bacterium]
MSRAGLLLVISGPSGVGKTTIVREIVRRFDGYFSVSATTRPKSDIERDGVDYWFIDQATFQKWIDTGRFLEHAQVFGRHWYGTPAEPVDQAVAQGRIAVLDIDVQGAESVRQKRPAAFSVFILPPSEAELRRRLESRRRDDAAAIERRFAEATHEMARARREGTYDAFVVNDDLAAAVDAVEHLVRDRLGAGDREASASPTGPDSTRG